MTAGQGRSSPHAVRALKDGWPADAEVSKWLSSYRPKKVRSEVWDGPLAAFVVKEAGRLVVELDTMKRFVRVLSRIGAWCVDNGIPLDVETVLDPDTIERFLLLGAAGEPDSTLSTWRGELRRIGPALTRSAPWEPPIKGFSRKTLPAPYSEREVRLILRDAAHQSTPLKSRSTLAIVALGLGAGLDGRWNCKIKGTEVEADEGGLVVNVPGPLPRTVPIRDCFSETVRSFAEEAGDGPFVGRLTNDLNAPNEITRNAVIDQNRVLLQSGRLRSTWLVAQLNAGTHIAVVTGAAGMTRIDTLRDLMEFVRLPSDDDATAQLRRA